MDQRILFNDVIETAKAYDKAALEINGEYALINVYE